MTTPDAPKAARCGEASYVWRAGQERRLRMMLEAAGERVGGRVLDNGCGVGLYLERFEAFSGMPCGLEFDAARAAEAGRRGLKVVRAAGEKLPFPSGAFDLVLSHEVLEHVEDDREALEEITRVLKPPDRELGLAGGRLLLFVPNRGYPFETHGIFWRDRYVFGNIPLVNYLPRSLRNQLAPHVRTYGDAELERLLRGLPLRIIRRTVIFGAYDNLIARWPTFGRFLRAALHQMEHTPLRRLGLSHFWVLERV